MLFHTKFDLCVFLRLFVFCNFGTFQASLTDFYVVIYTLKLTNFNCIHEKETFRITLFMVLLCILVTLKSFLLKENLKICNFKN